MYYLVTLVSKQNNQIVAKLIQSADNEHLARSQAYIQCRDMYRVESYATECIQTTVCDGIKPIYNMYGEVLNKDELAGKFEYNSVFDRYRNNA